MGFYLIYCGVLGNSKFIVLDFIWSPAISDILIFQSLINSSICISHRKEEIRKKRY